MRILTPIFWSLVGWTISSFPSLAVDCSVASTPIEKAICQNADLKSADAAMTAAYSKLLKSTADRILRDQLIFSQRRWIAAREQQGLFTGSGSNDDVLAGDGAGDDIDTLLGEIQDRTATLDDSSRSNPVARVAQERSRESRYTGGPYAGYRTQCFFEPAGFGDGSYYCAAIQVLQNNNNVCTGWTEWASEHTTDYQRVGHIVDGKLTTIATCAIGYDWTDSLCPDDPSDDDAHWAVGPGVANDTETPDLGDPPVGSLTKYDPDVPDLADEDWMKQCLTDDAFPLDLPKSQIKVVTQRPDRP